MASYNGEKYIGQQLDSILGQTLPGIRILVSDDGSTDGTVEILKQYQRDNPGRIFLSGCPENETGDKTLEAGKADIPPAARNFFRLLSQADADYVLLSDQDDVWMQEKAERLLERMRDIETDGVPALVFSDMEVADCRLGQIAPSFFDYSHCDPTRLSLAELLVENPVTGGALMMNRPLLELVREMPAACFMHDWWIALCASAFGVISCVRRPLSLYRQHDANVLGAKASGSLEDLAGRPDRQAQVEENYRRMFAQAAAFGKMYGRQLTDGQRAVLRAFLALPLQSPAGRLRNIVRNHFYKSSKLQTMAMCFTIPRGVNW